MNTRAVIRAVDAHNAHGVIGQIVVSVNDNQLLMWFFQANPVLQHLDTRLVLYAGERLGAFVQTPLMMVTISGYLFDDTIGRRMPTGEWTAGTAAGPGE